MKNETMNWFKRWKLKWSNSIEKKLYPDDILTERQQIGLDIFTNSLNDNNCVRMLNIPGLDEDKKYIVSKDYFIDYNPEMCITFITTLEGDSKCNIVNHEYLYDVTFPVNTTFKLNKMFKQAVVRDRSKMEGAFNKNSTNSLTKILQELLIKMKSSASPLSEDEIITFGNIIDKN